MPQRILRVLILLVGAGCDGGRDESEGLDSGPPKQIYSFDQAVVLPLVDRYCTSCHGVMSGRPFQLSGIDRVEENSEAVAAHLGDIVERLTRVPNDPDTTDVFMPPAGREELFNQPAIPASLEFVHLQEQPGDLRRLLAGLIGENETMRALVRKPAYTICGGCHNSHVHAKKGLQFFPPGAGLDEVMSRLAAKQSEIEVMVENELMPPANSIPDFNLKQAPYLRVQMRALFLTDSSP